ncbi:DUF4192 family protein, partial [uncultured Microbacterium sp.]|uniref:DUF4192 family protein n=1 Tax=uncultured Microbacterium sp. TaxID=191216 RepID=UPI0028E719D2
MRMIERSTNANSPSTTIVGSSDQTTAAQYESMPPSYGSYPQASIRPPHSARRGSHGPARASTLVPMSLTVKAADAAQFLSLVPRLLGFTPTQSLVLVPMARGRSLGAMRLDLPHEDLVDTVAS